jgi:glutathione synthase/RimK-type ligase-like ATP-grasp enzyme
MAGDLMKHDGVVKVGLFVPARDYSLPTSFDKNPGIIPLDVRDNLVARLNSLEQVEITDGIDFRNAIQVNGKSFVGDTCLNDFDVFFWYSKLGGGLESYSLQILDNMSSTVKVINDPKAMRLGLDKLYAHTALKQSGLNVSDFACFRNDQDSYKKILPLLEKWGSVLVKPRLGSFGHGIIKVDDPSLLRDVVGYTRSFEGILNSGGGDKDIFIERFYENDLSHWTSTTVIGGNLVYGYRKKPEKFVDNWKVYDEGRIGGCVDYVSPSPEYNKLALDATKVLGLDVIGYDIIETLPDKKLIIVDENTYPGFYVDLFKKANMKPEEPFFNTIKAYVDEIKSVKNRSYGKR